MVKACMSLEKKRNKNWNVSFVICVWVTIVQLLFPSDYGTSILFRAYFQINFNHFIQNLVDFCVARFFEIPRSRIAHHLSMSLGHKVIMATFFTFGSAILIPVFIYLCPNSVSTAFFTSPAFFYALTFILGCFFPAFFSQIGSRIARWLDGPVTAQKGTKKGNDIRFSKNDDSLYGLDHAILNVPSLHAETMWMNMGYWRVSSVIVSFCCPEGCTLCTKR